MNGENTSPETHSGTDAERSAHSIATAQRYPRSVEPRSPMNIFAGGKLNGRNPRAAAATTRTAAASPGAP